MPSPLMNEVRLLVVPKATDATVSVNVSSMDAASPPMALSAVARFASSVPSWVMMRSRAPTAGLPGSAPATVSRMVW